MRHDKLERELDLMLMLTENRHYTVEDICKRMNMSRRNFYYYIEFFRMAGFKVEHNRPWYSLSRESPFFHKLREGINFTEDEALTLRRILNATGDQSIQVQRLRQKLERFYDLQILDGIEVKEQLAHNVSMIYAAIKGHLMVRIVNYSSPHSNTRQDRLVEPFELMNGNREVRCYELTSQMNKTFKLSRMQDVELLDVEWQHESEHRQLLTDVFMFSGERQWTVTLVMGRLSASLLSEEYPRANRYMKELDEGRWLVEMPVSSFVGVGRFVLGLYDDMEVRGCQEFREYLEQKVRNFGSQMGLCQLFQTVRSPVANDRDAVTSQ
jgi:predicted DNA-binding transcriptional regulator YafY